jgi:hypothetical protein
MGSHPCISVPQALKDRLAEMRNHKTERALIVVAAENFVQRDILANYELVMQTLETKLDSISIIHWEIPSKLWREAFELLDESCRYRLSNHASAKGQTKWARVESTNLHGIIDYVRRLCRRSIVAKHKRIQAVKNLYFETAPADVRKEIASPQGALEYPGGADEASADTDLPLPYPGSGVATDSDASETYPGIEIALDDGGGDIEAMLQQTSPTPECIDLISSQEGPTANDHAGIRPDGTSVAAPLGSGVPDLSHSRLSWRLAWDLLNMPKPLKTELWRSDTD